MKFSFYPYTLQLKHVFTLATSSRNTTPIVLTEIHHNGFVGYGEASLPPYLSENQETVCNFLRKVDLSPFESNFSLPDMIDYINNLSPGNYAAKASVDIALHDLWGKLQRKPCYEIWNLNPALSPKTSFTIGIDSIDNIKKKLKEAGQFGIIKVKLGANSDKEIIRTIRSLTDKPICVDVNQGWNDKYLALDMLAWCKEHGVIFVEQPMPVNQIEETSWLTQHNVLPVIADESFQHINDLQRISGVFSGINIKLMKCGGLHQARHIINEAKKLNLKIMLGCMTETSCAVSAAAQLASLVDYTDLDGNLLITNDCFSGATIVDGKVMPTNHPGIGVLKKD